MELSIGTGLALNPLYIELFADEWTERKAVGHDRWGSRVSSLSRACISIPDMLNRIVDTCVLLGEPGAGKTTVLRWIEQSVRKGILPEFSNAILVSLRSFVLWLEKTPSIDLISFYVQSEADSNLPHDANVAASDIRATAKNSKRVLLLLDGWDEVPGHLRDRVKKLIQRESEHFLVVLSSRASGYPLQAFTGRNPKTFELAGLAPSAIRDFVEKHLAEEGKERLIEPILAAVLGNNELSSVASNPFLLSILVQVLAHPAQSVSFSSRASIYEAITNWMLSQSKNVASPGHEMIGRHLEGLEKLAFRMLFAEQSPRFAFPEAELASILGTDSVLPIERSRFVFQVDLNLHLWSFLHATLEEYFAARGLNHNQDSGLSDALNRMLLSRSRLVSLEFFAGLSEETKRRCTEMAQRWLDRLDRYSVLLIRLMRIAAAAGWKHSAPEVYRSIVERLWSQIARDDQWYLARDAIATFAACDTEELLRLATREPKLGATIQDAISNCVKPEILRESSLFDRLHKQLKDFIASRTPQSEISANSSALIAEISKVETSTERLVNLLNLAKRTGSAAVAEAILDRLRMCDDTVQKDECVLALASMATRLADNSLVEVLTNSPVFCSELRQVAAKTICIESNCGQRINPHIRDQLIQALKQLPKNDDRTELILDALLAYPIRDGGQVIASIACDQDVNRMIRISALAVLKTVMDDELVKSVLQTISSETEVGIVDFMVDLALARKVPLPSAWLEDRICTTIQQVARTPGEGLDRRELLGSYLRLANDHEHSCRKRCLMLLVTPVLECLLGKVRSPDESSIELSTAVRGIAFIRELLDIEPQIATVSDAILRQCTLKDGPSIGQAQLALAILGHKREVVATLQEVIPKVIAAAKKSERKQVSRLEALAQSMSDVIADQNVGSLLELANRFPLVDEILRKRSIAVGLVLVENCVFDVDGNLVENRGTIESRDNSKTPGDVVSLLAKLPPASQRAVLSYWLVLQRFQASGPKEVHSILKKAQNAGIPEEDAEFILQAQSQNIPKLETWRRAFYRGIEELEGSYEGREFVEQLNLPRK